MKRAIACLTALVLAGGAFAAPKASKEEAAKAAEEAAAAKAAEAEAKAAEAREKKMRSARKNKARGQYKEYTKYAEAVKMAQTCQQPIFVYAYVKDSDSGNLLKTTFSRSKPFKEFANMNLVVWRCQLNPQKPEKGNKPAKNGAPDFSRIRDEAECAVLKKVHAAGGVAFLDMEGKGLLLGADDVPKLTADLDFGVWLQTVVSIAETKKLSFEISDAVKAFMEADPAEKKKGKKGK
ncbi:MAG: hypothetical protein MJ138_04320 [Kiritimatiellae bacterium]|nr:hypothetical protein [Kiritimatiellia bacterium]